MFTLTYPPAFISIFPINAVFIRHLRLRPSCSFSSCWKKFTCISYFWISVFVFFNFKLIAVVIIVIIFFLIFLWIFSLFWSWIAIFLLNLIYFLQNYLFLFYQLQISVAQLSPFLLQLVFVSLFQVLQPFSFLLQL